MIWPFKKTVVEEPKLLDFEDSVRFKDRATGKYYKYCPTDDITAREVALIWPLCYAQWMNTDFFAYIRRHNLMRHFKEIVEEE